jgi:hypothetical protein
MRTSVVFAVLFSLHGSIVSGAEPTSAELAGRVIAAAGGEGKLLKLFRIEERLYVGKDPQGVGKERRAIMELPDTWWQLEAAGPRDRGVNGAREQARFVAWAWTLRILADPRTKLEIIPPREEQDRPAHGLRVSGTITPPLDMYFNDELRLMRVDWKDQYTRFSDWRSFDGLTYPARIVGFYKKDQRQWYISEVLRLERLTDLPPEMKK